MGLSAAGFGLCVSAGLGLCSALLLVGPSPVSPFELSQLSSKSSPAFSGTNPALLPLLQFAPARSEGEAGTNSEFVLRGAGPGWLCMPPGPHLRTARASLELDCGAPSGGGAMTRGSLLLLRPLWQADLKVLLRVAFRSLAQPRAMLVRVMEEMIHALRNHLLDLKP